MESICTSEDMVAGGVELPESKCLICCQESKSKAGYIGIYCYNCKRIVSGEEWAGDIARQRREILGMTRKQIGEQIGKSKHTIHGYEWKKCPKSYLDKLEEMLKTQK